MLLKNTESTCENLQFIRDVMPMQTLYVSLGIVYFYSSYVFRYNKCTKVILYVASQKYNLHTIITKQ